MLTKPTPAALRSIYSYSRQMGWEEVTKLFEAELAKTYETMTESRDPVVLHQLQGRAKFILEFLALVRKAPQLLEMLKESTL